MKFSRSAWIAVALLGVFAFTQYRTIDQLRDQLSAGEEYSLVLSTGVEDSAQERLELLKRIADLEEQLLHATYTPATRSAVATEIDDYELDESEAENRQEPSQDEPRFTKIGDNAIMLNIPTGPVAEFIWKTTEQLKSTIDHLDEELSFTIEKQSEEFQSVDISAYSDFLDLINMDETTRQNILAQLIDANREGFTRMLHRAVELQVNGYVAFVGSGVASDGYDQLMRELSPAGVMNSNLDSGQLREFDEFEANRLSRRAASPDYIAELVQILGL